jgi:DNA-binding transcriptional regulator YiaG
MLKLDRRASTIACMGSKAEKFDGDGLTANIRAARLPSPAVRRRLREDAGLSLREVARLLEVDVMTVLRWERGSRPRRANAVRYRALLDALEAAAE